MEDSFSWLGSFAVRRPGPIIGLLALLVLACVAVIPGLSVSTSRYGLVSKDNPQQARTLRFFERFGYPDVPTVLVSGGSAEERRAVVDRLTDGFEGEPDFAGRVLARVDPKDFAELLLLYQPDGLATMRTSLPPDVELADVVEGGLPKWLSAIEAQIYAGLDGTGAADAASAELGLRQLATAAKTFDDYLAGKRCNLEVVRKLKNLNGVRISLWQRAHFVQRLQ